MDNKLLKDALIKYVCGVILVGVLLFLPAWDMKWMNGWLLMAILFIPMFIAGIIMYKKAPDLLRSRLNARETKREQKDVINYSGIMFLAAFILAGLDHRFGWTHAPAGAVWTGTVIFLVAYCLFGEVLRENRYLSRTIEVQEDQEVVSTGLYGVVRHPMYTATVLLFLSMPLVLGSLPSLIVMLAYIPIIVKRIRNEEQVLEGELKGYSEYKEKVKYRLIPYIW